MKQQPSFMPGAGQTTEIMIFRLIWLFSERRSYVSNLWLREFENTPLYPNMFAHVLPKAMNKYPYFKYYAKNIVLLTPGEHSLWDQGTEEARISYSLDLEEKSGGKNKADWGKLKQLETELKEEYKKLFPTTRGMIIGVKYSIYDVQEILGPLNKKYFEELQSSRNPLIKS